MVERIPQPSITSTSPTPFLATSREPARRVQGSDLIKTCESVITNPRAPAI